MGGGAARLGLALAALAALPPPLAAPALAPNALGAPQDLRNASGVDVCRGRSAYCNVLLDVPTRCAGAGAARCPVLFCLHGFGGSNRKYVQSCGGPAHARGFIGVYPQGDPLAGTAAKPAGFGWNDGMAVNPGNTLLRCRWDNYSCTLDPNDGLFFRAMVGALRAVGAGGRLYAFGQSNGADWVQRLGVNAGPEVPFAGIAPQSGQLNAHPPRSASLPSMMLLLLLGCGGATLGFVGGRRPTARSGGAPFSPATEDVAFNWSLAMNINIEQCIYCSAASTRNSSGAQPLSAPHVCHARQTTRMLPRQCGALTATDASSVSCVEASRAWSIEGVADALVVAALD